mgnify:CR=1 FL=1
MLEHYDRQGNPIDPQRWLELRAQRDYVRIAEASIGKWWVSTVWFGMNMAFTPHQRPLIFETLVFDINTNQATDYMQRYSTEVSALAGHDQAEAWARDN